MVEYTLDKENGIVRVRPTGPLAEADFNRLATEIDPFIEESGGLNGLILEVSRFPGWENFGSAVRHFRFVREHHKKIKKVAIATDSMIGDLAEHVASHFVAAEIKKFDDGELEAAMAWITGN